jgi:drug/metabolite transporter (DMT)-like permease
MTTTEWGLLILLSLLWGGSYFYNAIAVKALPPLTIVTVRVVLGALLVYAVVRASGARMPRDGRTWRALFTMGLINNVIPFSMIAWSQGHVTSGLASILNATTPLFGVVFAHFTTRDEKMSPARVGGVIIGIVGVVFMIGPDALSDATDQFFAEIVCLSASILYAASGIYGRRFGRAGLPPLVTAAGQITASSVMMIPLAAVVDQPWTLPVPGFDVWAALIGLGAISTCLAYIVYYRILATAGAVNLLLVTLLIPVTAILLGSLLLGERLAINDFAGMALIGLGLAAIDGRPLRALMRRQVA